MTEHRNIKEADVRYVVHSVDRRADNIYHSSVSVHTEILCNLVIGALNKCGIGRVNRSYAAFSHTGTQSHSFFLGNANVDILASHLFPYLRSKACSTRNGRHYGNQLRIVLCLLCKILAYKCRKILLAITCRSLQITCLKVERHAPVESFLVLYCRRIAMSFLRMNVYNDRALGVLHLLKCGYKRGYVVAVLNINIVEPHSLKEV